MKRLAGLLATLALLPVLAACTGTPPPAVPEATGGGPSPTSSADAVIAELLARPLTAPTLAAGAACPVSPTVEHSPVSQPADALGLGRGPLYPLSFFIGTGALALPTETSSPAGMFEIKIVWGSAGDYQGPAVVRVSRVDGVGRGYVRLYYDQTASRGDAVVFQLRGMPGVAGDWPAGTFVSGPGCYAYQVDGVGFSELIYFSVRR